MNKHKNIILILVLAGSIMLFLILTYTGSETGLTTVPFVGGIFSTAQTVFHLAAPGSNHGSGQAGTNTNSGSRTGSSASKNMYNLGADTGSGTVIPVMGTKLSPAGGYRDGTYLGIAITGTGVLTLNATIFDGAITTITFQTVPTGASTIVLQALAAEAVKDQAVEVSPINGYDDLSEVFKEALTEAVEKSFK